MIYPQNFAERCKEVYPDWNELHRAIEKGSEIVGRYLDDASNERISPLDIINADKLFPLKQKARRIIAKLELYIEWTNLRHGQRVEQKESGDAK